MVNGTASFKQLYLLKQARRNLKVLLSIGGYGNTQAGKLASAAAQMLPFSRDGLINIAEERSLQFHFQSQRSREFRCHRYPTPRR